MGCGASTNNISKPRGKSAAENKSKRMDVQTTYRERLGEDFIAHFAKSEVSIRDLAITVEPGRSPGRVAPSTSTQACEETLATGTLISPYTTPPKGLLPNAHADSGDSADAPARGPHSTSSLLSLTDFHDTSGPYISSNKPLRRNSRLPSRPGSRVSTKLSETDEMQGGAEAKRRCQVPPRLQPLSHCSSLTRSTSLAPDGPQRSQLL